MGGAIGNATGLGDVLTVGFSAHRRGRSRFRKASGGPDLLRLPQMAALMGGLAGE